VRSGMSGRIVVGALALWIAALGVGFTTLLGYKSTPGAMESRPFDGWPAHSRLSRNGHGATLVMFAHPRCPCTRASISELARLMARVPDGLAAYVVFVRPEGVPADWDQTDLRRRAAAIPGVAVMSDDDGIEADRFHALTSGVTLVFDREGRRLFQGGITPSRGHEGDSFGRERIISLLTTGKADRNDSPVFGCALGRAHGTGARSLEDES
jgi:hypothetical protein